MAIEIEQPVVGLSKIAVSETHGEDSPYFAGWKAYDENPYDESSNPSGVIQMGLAENQVSFDLLEEYLEKHSEASTWGKGELEIDAPNLTFLKCDFWRVGSVALTNLTSVVDLYPPPNNDCDQTLQKLS